MSTNGNEIKTLVNQMQVQNNNLQEQSLKIKEFSNTIPSKADLPTVPTAGGLFGLFGYSVTGTDLNSVTKKISSQIITQNKTIKNIITEFEDVYTTLTTLNTSYIQKIMLALSAADEANNKAVESLKKLSFQQQQIQESHYNVEQMVRQQQQLIKVLTNFKEKIDRIEHLNDIDGLYEKSSVIQQNLNALAKGQENLQLSMSEANEGINENFIHISENLEDISNDIINLENDDKELQLTLKDTNIQLEELDLKFENSVSDFQIFKEEITDINANVKQRFNEAVEKQNRVNADNVDTVKELKKDLARITSETNTQKKIIYVLGLIVVILFVMTVLMIMRVI